MRIEDNITWCNEEEHVAMCRAVKWLYYGDRRTCDLPAEHFIGDAIYGVNGRFGYCRHHWPDIERAFRHEIMTAPTNGWVMEELMHRGKREYFRAADHEWWRVREQAKQRFKELFATGFINTSVVYFVQMGDSAGPIKIGTTKDINARIRSLAVGSPYPLNVLLLIPGGADLESSLHDLHSQYRLSGEWFAPDATLIEHINAMRNGPIPNALF